MLWFHYPIYLDRYIVKGSVREKQKGHRLRAINNRFLIASNLTSICCIYKEKLKRTSHIEKYIQIEKIETYDRKKNQVNVKQIIQILNPIIVDYFSRHLCIVDFS